MQNEKMRTVLSVMETNRDYACAELSKLLGLPSLMVAGVLRKLKFRGYIIATGVVRHSCGAVKLWRRRS